MLDKTEPQSMLATPVAIAPTGRGLMSGSSFVTIKNLYRRSAIGAHRTGNRQDSDKIQYGGAV